MTRAVDPDLLRRARLYPYDAPDESYTWHNGDIRPFDPDRDRAGRTPVLAFGSNRAPERLDQKFRHLGHHRIPVERIRLHDFDVVYAAHITSYGAVPAMLQHAPGTEVTVAVTWLDEDQLPIMHRSEMAAANYVFAELSDVRVDFSDGGVGGSGRRSVYGYIGARGHFVDLEHSGTGKRHLPVPLSAIPARNRRGRPATTEAVLERIRERVARGMDADLFVHRLVQDIDYRHSVTAAISRDAVPFAYPYTVLDDGSGL